MADLKAEEYDLHIASTNVSCWAMMQDDRDVQALNIMATSVKDHGASSSELPDEEFGKPKPDYWGRGTWHIADGITVEMKAQEHCDTKLPLGEGCRWERQVLNAKNYPIWVYRHL